MTFKATWSDERIALLKKWHAEEGCSGGVIAARLGISRNAVIGKIHRLGIGRGHQRQPKLRKPAVRKPPVPWTRDARRRGNETMRAKVATASGKRAHAAATMQAMAERERLRALPDLHIPPERRRTLLDLTDEGGRDCHWAYGDGTKADPYYFCDRKALKGMPYCDDHCKRAYNPVVPLRGYGPVMRQSWQSQKPGPADYSPSLREFDKMEIA